MNNRVLAAYERIGLLKNKLIGGDMATNPWVLGTSFAAMANNQLLANRFRWGHTSGSTVATGSKVVGESDGRSAMRLETTTANAAPAAGDADYVFQRIRGSNILDLLNGAFVSTRIKSNLTGIQALAVRNSVADNSFISEVNIDVADTWQTVKFPISLFDIGFGTWDFTTGIGLQLIVPMSAGTNHHGTADVWTQTGDFSTVGSVNRNANIGDYIEIDQIQIEPGNVFTDFAILEKSIVDVLCESYYEVGGFIRNTSSSFAAILETLPVEFRTTKISVPTMSNSGFAAANMTGPVTDLASINGFRAGATVTVAGTASASFDWAADSEL